MARYIEFEGRTFIIPGAYGKFQSKGQVSELSPDLNTLIIIGPADNGWYFNDTTLPMEMRVLEFSSFQEAKEILKSGDLLDAIKVAFSPSKDQRFATGPVKIKAINISNNVKASATIQDINNNNISINAIIPGKYGNEIRFKISNSGDKLEIGDSNEIQARDNLARTDIIIQYVGNGTTADLTIDSNNIKINISGQTDGSQSLTISKNDVKTLQDLADVINSKTGYVATIESSPDWKVEYLDYVNNVSVLTPYNIKSIRKRQYDAFLQTGYAEIPSGNIPLQDTTNFIYLTGGQTNQGTTTDYIDAITLCEQLTAFYINVCSSNIAVASALSDYLFKMNSIDGKNEKFGGCGADITQPFDDRIKNAKILNNPYMVYGVSPVKLYKSDGITEKIYDGWMLAIIHNAIKASNNVRESAFYKDLNILDAPEQLTETQKKKALEYGCLIVDKKPNGIFKITHDVTTYQKTDLILQKASTVCTALALVKDLRESLELNFTGEVPTDPSAFGTSLTDADIRTFIERKFDIDYIQRYGWLTRNIYTGEPAWDRNFTIFREGNVYKFIFPDGKIVTSIDFMFFLLKLDVVRGQSAGL